ncbi:MAG: hypothetical protein PHS07_02105 [Patescibacteria group bacterium]|nr:hypothetical protein [Patescibacteria group bacterium]
MSLENNFEGGGPKQEDALLMGSLEQTLPGITQVVGGDIKMAALAICHGDWNMCSDPNLAKDLARKIDEMDRLQLEAIQSKILEHLKSHSWRSKIKDL